MTQTGQTNRKRTGQAGFTLVELMVVIAIIAILATIVGANVIGALGDASQTQAKAQIKNFKTALINYRIKFNKFPSSSEGLQALITNDKGQNFLDSPDLPKDPWKNPYVYTSEGSSKFLIVSYGSDGKPGGTGEDADITSDNEASDK